MHEDWGAELGTYRHILGSLHLYDRDNEAVSRYLNEGWQPTTVYMPACRQVIQQSQLAVFLDAESNVRLGRPFDLTYGMGLDKYWADLVRLLQLYHCSTNDGHDSNEVL